MTARIGLVVPSTNTTVEQELPRSWGCSWHVTRVLQRETEDPGLKIATVLDMLEELPAATERLAGLGPVVLGFACTAASFLRGAAADRDISAALAQQAGVPFVTASTAVGWALGALGVRRLVLVTPYIKSVNQREVNYLAELGLVVTKASGLGIVGNLGKGRLGPKASLDAARRLARSPGDAVFLSCTNWSTGPNLDLLAAEQGRPVVSSNSALFWALARMAGSTGRLPDVGALAELPLPPTSSVGAR